MPRHKHKHQASPKQRSGSSHKPTGDRSENPYAALPVDVEDVEQPPHGKPAVKSKPQQHAKPKPQQHAKPKPPQHVEPEPQLVESEPQPVKFTNLLRDQGKAITETEKLLSSKGKMNEEVFMDSVDRIIELSEEADSELQEIVGAPGSIVHIDKCVKAIELMSAEVEKINDALADLEKSYQGTSGEYKRKREELVDDYRSQLKQLQGSLDALKSRLSKTNSVVEVMHLVESAKGDLGKYKKGVVGFIKNVATSIFGYGKWPLQKKLAALEQLKTKLEGVDSSKSAVLEQPPLANLLRTKREAEKKTEELLGGGLFFKGKMNQKTFENHVEGIIEKSEEVDGILEDVAALERQEEPLTSADTKACIEYVDECLETILSMDKEIKKIEEDLSELKSSYDETGKGYKGKRQELIGTYEVQLGQMKQALSEHKKVLASGSGKKAVEKSLETVQSSLKEYKGGVARFLWNAAANVFGYGKFPLQAKEKDLKRLQGVLKEMREAPVPVSAIKTSLV